MILAGAAVMGLAGAGLSLALNFAPNPYAAYEITTWLLGSLAERSWSQLLLATPFMLIGMGLLLANMRALDALTLGETQAASLGIDLDRARLLALLGTALAVGRRDVGHGRHRVHRPARAASGAAFRRASAEPGAAACRPVRRDPAARRRHRDAAHPHDQEVKLGVLTSLAGTPFFFWLVLRLRRTSP